MSLLEWTPEMSVGVDVIDTDHQLLVSLINQLNDAVKTGQGQATTGSVLNVLYDYTGFHFGREEMMMEAALYPELEEHKKAHIDLKSKVLDIRNNYISGKVDGIEEDVMNLLKDWLKDHIMGRDRLYQSAMVEHRDKALEAAEKFNSSSVWLFDEGEVVDDPFDPKY
jgi:hemerythrin